jgi:hypothetical protein
VLPFFLVPSFLLAFVSFFLPFMCLLLNKLKLYSALHYLTIQTTFRAATLNQSLHVQNRRKCISAECWEIKKFWALCGNTYERIVITVVMVWWSRTVERFWALWDNILTVAMVMLLKETFNFYMLLCGNSALKHNIIHSPTACYVHVLLYNAANIFTY